MSLVHVSSQEALDTGDLHRVKLYETFKDRYADVM